MEAAGTAIDKLLGRSGQETTVDKSATVATGEDSMAVNKTVTSTTGQEDTNMDQNVAPAVEHEKITEQHEERATKVIEKEKHQDHYVTVEQPLQDRQVNPTEHTYEQSQTEHVNVNHDDGNVQQDVERRQNGYSNTTEQGPTVSKKTETTELGDDHVHHHVHQTIQPVIEKEVIQPTVTHKTIPVKEHHQEASVDHGVVRNAPVSKDEFMHNLGGESTHSKDEYPGKPKEDSSA